MKAISTVFLVSVVRIICINYHHHHHQQQYGQQDEHDKHERLHAERWGVLKHHESVSHLVMVIKTIDACTARKRMYKKTAIDNGLT